MSKPHKKDGVTIRYAAAEALWKNAAFAELRKHMCYLPRIAALRYEQAVGLCVHSMTLNRVVYTIDDILTPIKNFTDDAAHDHTF